MKTTATATIALAALLGLGACGSSDGTAGSAGASASTTSGTSTATGAGAESGKTVDGAELAGRMTSAMIAAGSGRLSMDLGDQGTSSGSFVMSSGKMEQQMTMSIQGQSVEVISTGGVIYLKGLPGSSKPWVKVDPKATDPLSSMFAGLAGDMGDPRQLATALKGTKATVVSSTAKATVYDVTINPSALLGSEATAAPSAEPVKARYTLDAKDRPTEMTVQAQGQTITITFSDWGSAVKVAAPPADQVGTFQLPTS